MVLEIFLDWTTTQYLLSSAFFSVITYWIINNQFSKQRRPNNTKKIPGSMGWPILGHLPYINQASPYALMDYYTHKYGPIFQIQMGSFDAVVLTDYHLIKQAFNHPDMTLRPTTYGQEIFSSGFHGLAFSSGPLWQEQRRFALRQLRELGLEKSSFENHILREISAITDGLKSHLGEPVDLGTDLTITITNIVWTIVAGKRMEYDDPKFIKFVADFSKIIQLLSSFGALSFIPWMTKIFPDWLLGIQGIKKELKDFMEYADQIVQEHLDVLDPENPMDYIDHFLVEQMNHPHSTFTDIQLKASINDFFTAGGETTATTLRWAILLINKHPNVMKKLQEEIDSVVGRDRLPCLGDQNRMPYTTAVIHEVQRYSDIVPLGALHCSEKDVVFEGFYIPKGTIIMGVHGHSHRNKKYWSKPNEFYPEHFLDVDGQLRQNVEGFFPFSTGKRICIGERFARAELFLFTTHLYHQFNIRIADYPISTLAADPKSGSIRNPSPYKAIMTLRD